MVSDGYLEQILDYFIGLYDYKVFLLYNQEKML